MIEGLRSIDLAKFKVGDVLSTVVAPLAGVAPSATLQATVVDVGKTGIVCFDVHYLGVLVGEYGAKADGGRIIWVDVQKARKERAK